MVDLKNKQISPTEVLWYDYCPKAHYKNYVENCNYSRPWLDTGLEGQKRSFLHGIYQMSLSDKINLKPEYYPLISLEEQNLLLKQMSQSLLNYQNFRLENNCVPYEVTDVEAEITAPLGVTRFDNLIELVEDGKRMKTFAEVKSFSKDEKLIENYERTKLQMRIAYQILNSQQQNLFGGRKKPQYDYGLLITIRSDNFQIYDKWIKLDESSEDILKKMEETKQNRFLKLEDVIENKIKCSKCSLKEVCNGSC